MHIASEYRPFLFLLSSTHLAARYGGNTEPLNTGSHWQLVDNLLLMSAIVFIIIGFVCFHIVFSSRCCERLLQLSSNGYLFQNGIWALRYRVCVICRSELDLGDKQGSWVSVTSKGIGTLLHLVIFAVTVICLLIWVKIHLWSMLVSQVVGITQVSIDLLKSKVNWYMVKGLLHLLSCYSLLEVTDVTAYCPDNWISP